MHLNGYANRCVVLQHRYWALSTKESEIRARIYRIAVRLRSIRRLQLTFFPVEFFQSKNVRPQAQQSECCGGRGQYQQKSAF